MNNIQEVFNFLSNIKDWVIANTDPVSAIMAFAAICVSILALIKAKQADLFESRMEVITKVKKVIEVYEGFGQGYVSLFGGDSVNDKILRDIDIISKDILMLFGKCSEKKFEKIVLIGNECRHVDSLFSEYDYLLHLNKIDIKLELIHYVYDDELISKREQFFNDNELNTIDIGDHKFYMEIYNLNDIFSKYSSAQSKLAFKKKKLLDSLYAKTKT